MQATSLRLPIKALLTVSLMLLAGASGAAGNASPNEAAIDKLARTWLAQNDGIGLSIGVYDNGQRRFYNYGTTQLDGNVVPTKDTIYDIGAISKTMAGQLLARAVVEGRASLDDDVAKYLDSEYKNLANDGQRIQLKHLAGMTSQLADNIPDLTQVRKVDNEPLAVTRMRVFSNYSDKEFLRQLERVAPVLPPGAGPARSNVSSMLLGIVLERIYGEPFETLLAREIEKPLRMGSGTNPAAKLLATGHTESNEVLPPYGAPTQFAVNSLRYSTDDLLRYASWQMVERDASVKLAHQPLWSTPDSRMSIAFFWIMRDSPLGRRLIFTGGTYGFASSADLYPKAGVAVVLLANKNTEGAQESLRALSANIAALTRPESVSQPSSADAPQPDR